MKGKMFMASVAALSVFALIGCQQQPQQAATQTQPETKTSTATLEVLPPTQQTTSASLEVLPPTQEGDKMMGESKTIKTSTMESDPSGKKDAMTESDGTVK